MKERPVQQYNIFLTLFIMGQMVTSAMYVTFLQENGMSLMQVNTINAVFFLTIFICEIPTGAFADIFGRKRSFITACFLKGVGSIVYGMSNNISGFIVAEIISGIGFTFMSGALKAWLVDSLIHRGYKTVDVKVFAKAKFYSQICGMVSCVVGSYMANYSNVIPWFVGGVIEFILVVLVYSTMKEEYFVHKKFAWKKGLSMMRIIVSSSIRYGVGNNAVRFILITTFIQILAVQPFNMFWQPFFGNLGISKLYFGYVFTGMMSCLAFGAYIACKTKVEGREKIMIIGSQIYVGILIILTIIFSDLIVVLTLFLFHEVGRGFWEPMRDSYLHKRIPSNERATIDSFCSIYPHIGGVFGLIFSGIMTQVGGISLAWVVSSLILIIGALGLAINSSQKAS